MIVRLNFRRVLLLPFSHGGRNFLWWWIVGRTSGACNGAARVHRAALSWRMRVVMVVGSYGKTTTTRATAAALGLPPDPWLEASANSRGLVGWALIRQPPWRNWAVVEAGIHFPGAIRRYARLLRPQVVVVTCIGNEHIQSFRDLEHLRSEKAEAVRSLRERDTAVLNADDPNVAWMAGETRARVVRYGFDPAWEFHVAEWSLDGFDGMHVALSIRGERFRLRTRLMGRNSIYSLLAAVAVAVTGGVPPALAVERLGGLPPTPGRLQRAPLQSGASALCDDFKSSFETVHAAFDVLAAIPATRRLVVLGGLDSPPAPQRTYYHAVSEHVSRVADEVIVVGDGFEKYAPGLRRGKNGGGRLKEFHFAPRVADAVRLLAARIGPGDVVLIKGQTSQRLARIVLALQGRDVRCAVDLCRLHVQRCGDCPLLGKPGPVGGIRLDDRVMGGAQVADVDRDPQ